MVKQDRGKVIDLAELRSRAGVFADRAEAGGILADMLERAGIDAGVVLGIPAGGVAVAAVIAQRLRLPLDLAVVSKITPSWNTEVGYGAVAWDGTVLLNESARRGMNLDEYEVQRGTAVAREKVRRRVALLRGDRPMPDLRDTTAILVDDGVATGWTTLCAIQALRGLSVKEIVLAVPTAHGESLDFLSPRVSCVYCPNIRRGWSFAVAEAYRHWEDVTDDQVAAVLANLRGRVQD